MLSGAPQVPSGRKIDGHGARVDGHGPRFDGHGRPQGPPGGKLGVSGELLDILFWRRAILFPVRKPSLLVERRIREGVSSGRAVELGPLGRIGGCLEPWDSGSGAAYRFAAPDGRMLSARDVEI